MKRCFAFLILCCSAIVCLSQSEEEYRSVAAANADNPDCMYSKAKLGAMLVHLTKITLTDSRESIPVGEMLASSDKFSWQPCEPIGNWGKPHKTQKYYEAVVPGTPVVLNVTNRLDDVTYYRIDGAHPYQVPLYESPREAAFLQRFVFFKFTATAAKGRKIFERKLNDDLYALDTCTKLIWSYSMPTDYEKILERNYIPQNWQPYELAPNTKNAGLKFYEYDPIGFIAAAADFVYANIPTNVCVYDWWSTVTNEGSNMETIKAKRFMPRVAPDAEPDWTVRDPKRPVQSPYRKK